MHDDLLERRLRAALKGEAGHLPFSITAAELERRMARRGRSQPRRLTLLLAATFAIGGLGAAGLLAGLQQRHPSPSDAAADATSPATMAPSTTPSGPTLPTLDELIAQAPPGVLVASAHGPSDGPGVAVSLGELNDQLFAYSALGVIQGSGDYVITMACFSAGSLKVAVLPAVGEGQTIEGPRIACGLHAIEQRTVHLDGPAEVWIGYHAPASWRVAVSSPFTPSSLPSAEPIIPAIDPAAAGELARVDDGRVGDADPAWGASGLRLAHVADLPARRFYAVRVWCEPGALVRIVFGDAIAVDLDALVACDGQIHEMGFDLRLPRGSVLGVAAAPGAHWSLVVDSAS
jgi:hypothetical protein